MSDSEDFEDYEDKVIEENTDEDLDGTDELIVDDTEEEIELSDEDDKMEVKDNIEEPSDIDVKIFKSSILSKEEFNNFYKIYDISKNKTSNILTKYEKTKILSERSEQLSSGAISLISNKSTNTLEIAEEEFKQNKIPFIIKRLINNNYEYWKLEDLIKL
tara:strand:- start:3962 stop:4441 length:480 start_codon:yes stop_codon:yes gene_type:complete